MYEDCDKRGCLLLLHLSSERFNLNIALSQKILNLYWITKKEKKLKRNSLKFYKDTVNTDGLSACRFVQFAHSTYAAQHFRMTDIDNILGNLQRFSWPDYVVFIAMFVLCILIGIYFGFMKKSRSEAEYLMGGRNMFVVPIALSLVASFISGITLLGLPTEIYSYGIQYLYVMGAVIAMGVIMGVFYLPVFHGLHITSTYEVSWNIKS